MLLSKLKYVSLSDQRLSACQHVKINAELLTLGDDPVHLIKSEIILVPVSSGPAACAVHIAGVCRIKEDEPGNVAAVLLAVCANEFCSPEECLIPKVQKKHFRYMGMSLIYDTVYEFDPAVIGILDGRPDLCDIILVHRAFSPELFRKINKLQI